MIRFRILLSVLAVAFSIASMSAQSKKLIANAEAKTVALNDKLRAIDESLALSDEQMVTIQELYVEGLQEMNAVRKQAESKEAGKEAVKPVRKALNKAIRKEALTKEQRTAFNAANKKK